MRWIFLRIDHELVEDGRKHPVEKTIWNIIKLWIGLLKCHVSSDSWTDVLEEMIETLGVLHNVSFGINVWDFGAKI